MSSLTMIVMTVQNIIQEVLEATVGVDDDFFDAGGDSLSAEQVVHRLEKQFGLSVLPTVIFDHPTVAQLAEFIRAQELDSATGRLSIQRSRKTEYRVSFAQMRLWLLYKLQPESPAYNLCDVYELRGGLDIVSLKQALCELVGRHETLRTTFRESHGEPLQCVAKELNLAFVYKDLSSTPEERREADAQELFQAEAKRVLDLEKGPLFRCLLLRMEENVHFLALTIHHIVSDRWSRQVMMSELAQLYGSFSQGATANLPELALQYGDYAEWLREWLGPGELEKKATYWREQLEGAPDFLNLPTDRPRGASQHAGGGAYHLELGHELSEELRILSQSEGVTLFMVLLAVFQILMARYSRQEDLCVGSPIAGRIRQEAEDLIGFFVNTLIFRARITGNPTFADFLTSTRKIALEAYGHQEMPFDELVKLLRPERSLASVPFVQVMFAFQNVPKPRIASGALVLNPVRIPTGVAKFDLSLMLEDGELGITGYLEFNADLFDRSTIERMANSYRQLLTAAVSDAKSPVYALKMMDEQERKMVLEEWNATGPTYRLEGEVVSLMERAAEMYGDIPAVVGEDGRLTYGELNACANQLAHLLQERGVGRGSLVGICMERSAAMITGMVAVLKAGAAYLPMDAGYPVERILYSLQESNTAILLTHTQLQARFSECGVKVLCVDQPGLFSGMPCNNLERKPEHNDCAYVIYTSGSTGRPKGVMISHRSLLNLALWHQHSYQVKAGDRASQIASPGFDACVWELWPYLISGATILVVDEETKLSPAKLQKWIVENDIKLAFLATPLAEAVLRELWPVPTRLRALLVGGDRLTQRPGENLPFRVINHYGPTEATVVTTAGDVAAMDDDGRLPDIGRPIANYKVYILDQDLQPVPIGVVGELYIGGEGVALGYLRDPDPGAPRFIDNPFGPGRLYRSGDLASFLKNGRIQFVGRVDEQVKIRGYRIELDEIKVVLDKHPMVAQSAVALESTPNGQSIVAYIVLREDSNKGIEQLRAGLAGQLPHYMIPSKFVLLVSLPLTPNGKVDRNKLDKLQPVALTNTYVQPQTELQKRVERIWNEILHVKDIGIHDNFFQLGGHSLLAAQVMTRINNVFRLELPLTALFEVPTIAGLAGYVEHVLGDDTELEALMELLQDQLLHRTAQH